MKLLTVARRTAWRFASSLPALFGVVIFTFVLMRLLPGDPAVFFASSPSAGKAEIEMIRKQMGLDRSIPEQLVRYLRDIGTGNLGRSMTTGQPVTNDLIRRLPASLELTVTALLIALTLALPAGIFAALRQNSLIDHAIRLLCTLGVCMPTFVSGLLFIFFFYYVLGWAPDPTGRIDIFLSAPPEITGLLLVDSAIAGNGEVFRAALHQLMLPASTMGAFSLTPSFCKSGRKSRMAARSPFSSSNLMLPVHRIFWGSTPRAFQRAASAGSCTQRRSSWLKTPEMIGRMR